MEIFTANYALTNHNFVIQNLPSFRKENRELAAICIIQNILLRGLPSSPSEFLLKKLGTSPNTKSPVPLISSDIPDWHHTIKGNSDEGDYPAKIFLTKIIPEYLPEYAFISSLLKPEVPFSEMVKNVEKSFKNQAVDFYLQQAFLVIEIDGQQHTEDESQRSKDKRRDEYLSKHQITTLRINTDSIRNRDRKLHEHIAKLKSILEGNKVLQVYKKTLTNSKVYQESLYTHLIPTAIMRFQVLVLKLLECEYISLKDSDWQFNVILHKREIAPAFDWALEDLLMWLHAVYKLQKLAFNKPHYAVKFLRHGESLPNSKKSLIIDFSLMKRWTDEANINEKIIYVRTDYINWRKKLNEGTIQNEVYNHFRLATTSPVKYKIQMGGPETDVPHFEFLLRNIFGYDHFKPGQLPIIKNALECRNTLGLLPTGGGKSLCYQLSVLLQPCVNIVITPIIALMEDQQMELQHLHIDYTELIKSDLSSERKDEIQINFRECRYFFILVSPERFQTPGFREALSFLDQQAHISYAVIDEVHCLSEWGHDFRLSYLKLAHTVHKCCPRSNPKFLGLTATASYNVLKDIQAELKVNDIDVKTLTKYNREELTFTVISDKSTKNEVLFNVLKELDDEMAIFEKNENYDKNGIIFTPFVNGHFGCYELAKILKNKFIQDVRWYAGSSPKHKVQGEKRDLYCANKLTEHRSQVQKEFKENKFPLLCATKAFGMGVNKKNIFYTIHYGIPSSLEAFYQEAGRAGRDRKLLNKTNAECKIIFSREDENSIIEKILYDPEATQADLLNANKQMGYDGHDAKRQIFLMANSVESVEDDALSLLKFYNLYCIPNRAKKNVILRKEPNNQLGKKDFQYYIYRMFLLGIVEDWTVEDFFQKIYKVSFGNFVEEDIILHLELHIQKYDKSFSLDPKELLAFNNRESREYHEIITDDQIPTPMKAFQILLRWSQNNIFYSRKESLKNLYDYCVNFEKIGSEEFKKRIEAYFTFSELTYILQDIAEDSTDNITLWFSVFWKQEDTFIDYEDLIKLEGNILRYLESYKNHTGLNIIYGFVQLISKGVIKDLRFEKEFPKLRTRLSSNEKMKLIFNSLQVGKQLKIDAKNYLANILYSFDPSLDTLHVIHKELEDYFSLHISLQKAQLKITSFNQRKNYG